ncbi:unnamed protein product [Hymenolepis diminuta]|uniref:Uncharacterized protein n=1 Tax=Hymenolepis diminuta TaxID=6216 RepID=A0A564YKN3_HYMDI|nr:unnamed protein product [Hymenolepis diminuta]
MLWRGLTQSTTHAGQCGLLHVLFISSLPQHAPLSLSFTHSLSVTRFKLVVVSLNTFLV